MSLTPKTMTVVFNFAANRSVKKMSENIFFTSRNLTHCDKTVQTTNVVKRVAL